MPKPLATFLLVSSLTMIGWTLSVYTETKPLWQGMAVCGILGLFTASLDFLFASRRAKEVPLSDDSEMGDFNTFYGIVKPPKKMGSGNTWVGPTEANGDVRISGGTAVGFGASADPTSVSIGAFAGGGRGKKPKGESMPGC